jgi:hypothetical protein
MSMIKKQLSPCQICFMGALMSKRCTHFLPRMLHDYASSYVGLR